MVWTKVTQIEKKHRPSWMEVQKFTTSSDDDFLLALIWLNLIYHLVFYNPAATLSTVQSVVYGNTQVLLHILPQNAQWLESRLPLLPEIYHHLSGLADV